MANAPASSAAAPTGTGPSGIGHFRYSGARPADLGEAGAFDDLFWSHKGETVHKWHHYPAIYDRYFGPWRGKAPRFLEIGVSKGGSLEIWRRFFGDDAVIFGIDIDPKCAQFDGQAGQVRIGSQDDPAFLNGVLDEMGGVDLVLDDGSHDSVHIRKTLEVAYPRLTTGGVYMIEDLHAAYWPNFSGGYDAESSFFTDVKRMIDDIHHWYHDRGQEVAATRDYLTSLHVHDSIVVLEKDRVPTPRHTKKGARFA
ncbi:MAG: class I SAM-dependent methyltransferase [Pseudomonadota bacterium]